MNLEKIIEVSHRIADPYIKAAEAWKYCCKVLSILLILSVGANIYLATRDVEVISNADDDIESNISQMND